MKSILMIVACCTIFFSSCKKRNYIYSASSLNHAYEYDPEWDYKGYNPEGGMYLYRTYQPDSAKGIVRKTSTVVVKESM